MLPSTRALCYSSRRWSGGTARPPPEGSRRMTRLLIVAQDGDHVVDWTIGPFRTFQAGLRVTLGATVEIVRSRGLEDLSGILTEHPADVAFISTTWKATPEDTAAAFAELARSPARSRLVYLDTFDQATTPFFGVLPHVDLYLKKQVYRDYGDYRRSWVGGHRLADFESRQRLGAAAPDPEHFGSVLPEEYDDRLWLGWNLGCAPKMINQALTGAVRPWVPWERREVGLQFRASTVDGDHWYTTHRRRLFDALAPLAGQPGVVRGIGTGARVPLSQFQRELRHARVSVSPYGWGEITDRDFRSIAVGAVLVKPDMSHLRTEPDVYRAWDTYLPVRWDGSDLVERVRYVWAHPQASQEMAKAAFRAWRRWFFDGRFLRRIREILEHLDAP